MKKLILSFALCLSAVFALCQSVTIVAVDTLFEVSIEDDLPNGSLKTITYSDLDSAGVKQLLFNLANQNHSKSGSWFGKSIEAEIAGNRVMSAYNGFSEENYQKVSWDLNEGAYVGNYRMRYDGNVNQVSIAENRDVVDDGIRSGKVISLSPIKIKLKDFFAPSTNIEAYKISSGPDRWIGYYNEKKFTLIKRNN